MSESVGVRSTALRRRWLNGGFNFGPPMGTQSRMVVECGDRCRCARRIGRLSDAGAEEAGALWVDLDWPTLEQRLLWSGYLSYLHFCYNSRSVLAISKMPVASAAEDYLHRSDKLGLRNNRGPPTHGGTYLLFQLFGDSACDSFMRWGLVGVLYILKFLLVEKNKE